MALSHPEVAIKYMANGQLKLHTSGNGQIKDVIYKIYGRDIAKQLLPVSWENEFLRIDGYLGKPAVSRGNRGFENYFINGRYVKDKIITRALEDGFHGYIMQHKYPFAVLQIEMDGTGHMRRRKSGPAKKRTDPGRDAGQKKGQKSRRAQREKRKRAGAF